MGAKAMSSHGSGGPLSRQGSVCSLTFSEVDGQLHGVNLDELLRAAAGKKTVDEVWRDIQQGGCPRAQMTLEDFLCRAADAAGSGNSAGGGARGWAQQQQYQPAHHHPAVGRPVPRPLGAHPGPVLDALYHDGHEPGLKRAVDGGAVVERSNERRKKRMIKNRESAARSRARKQAYTNELEKKVKWLEEENERLRSRWHKALEPVVQYMPQQLDLKNQLRRINSANF
ncbi:hypothetical protein PR202_gb19713 [Eleusine coracana subsp. coracana]|uniref:BZIP domain-containing protein n=1 Tax=Eleusine coracana subsp. coracana TaxID=191504 RepID=A0AAV5F9K1_ELECO|nr:hypothetical protein QOZ80_3BG0281700 [Eleusine coracana subsp. coracana]GJN31327.1 hypothetical protein PR202_gb19713 [Eleusine coracana subsp. coracana]